MPHGQDEPVAVRPDGILRVEPQEPLSEAVDHRRKGHRRPRMSRVRRLDRVHRQRPDSVDAQLI